MMAKTIRLFISALFAVGVLIAMSGAAAAQEDPIAEGDPAAPTDLVFITTPGYVQISLDDVEIRNGSTPFRYTVNPGTYVVSVAAPGYLPIRRQVTVGSGEQYAIDWALSRAESASAGQSMCPDALACPRGATCSCTMTATFDLDGDGAVDQESDYTFDARGNPLIAVEPVEHTEPENTTVVLDEDPLSQVVDPVLLPVATE